MDDYYGPISGTLGLHTAQMWAGSVAVWVILAFVAPHLVWADDQ